MSQNVRWTNLRQLLPGPWPADIELKEEDQIDEWTRESEPDPDEPMSHVGEVHLAPIPPVMTTEPPTLAGLYFVQIDAQSPLRVVEVYRDGLWIGCWSDIEPFAVASSGYLFSQHRIPEPRRP
jgi:hypothetical protein